MRSHTKPDLLTRIQEKHACSRSAARRILSDLVDHHKRLAMRRITGEVISNPVGARKVFSAPVNSRSTLRHPYRREIVAVGGSHPHKRTRDTDLGPISSKMATITVHHPEDGVPEEFQRPQRFVRPGEPYQTVNFIDINGHMLQKRDFIETCSYHGMSAGEISRFLVHFIEPKAAESEAEHYKRVYQQVYYHIKRSP